MAYYTPKARGEVVVVKSSPGRRGYELTVTDAGFDPDTGHYFVTGIDEDGFEMTVAHRFVYRKDDITAPH